MSHTMRLKLAWAGFVAVRSRVDARWGTVFDDVDELAGESADLFDSFRKLLGRVVDAQELAVVD